MMNDSLAITIEELEHTVAAAPTDHARIVALNDLALHLYASDPHEARAVSAEAVRLARSSALDQEHALPDLAASLLSLSACHERLGAYTAALSALHEARASFVTLSDQAGLTHTLRRISSLYGALAEHPQALAQFRSAADMPEATEHTHAEAALRQANRMLRARVDELALLNVTTQIVLEQTDLTSILNTVTQQVTEILGASGTIIALSTPDKASVRFVADHDGDRLARSFVGLTVPLADLPLIIDVLGAQQPLVLTQPAIDVLISTFDPAPRLGRFRHILLVPLIIRRETIGGFIITSDRESYAFGEAEVRLAQTLAGQVAGVIERAQLLDDAVRARAAAEAASESKSQFLTTISHELRMPLTGILGYTQLLALEGALSASQRELLGLVEQSSKHLMSLINDLLDLARIEADNLELQIEPCEFDLFVGDISAMAGTWAQQKGLLFQSNANEWLASESSRRVYVDARRLRQVLINLLGNAVKFTHSGQITLLVTGRPGGASRHEQARVRFQIDDTGVGIPPEAMQHIFLPFHQVGDANQRAAGTGLGLAICVELLRLMGSSLHAESTPGVGSTFWFELVLPVEASAA